MLGEAPRFRNLRREKRDRDPNHKPRNMDVILPIVVAAVIIGIALVWAVFF